MANIMVIRNEEESGVPSSPVVVASASVVVSSSVVAAAVAVSSTVAVVMVSSPGVSGTTHTPSASLSRLPGTTACAPSSQHSLSPTVTQASFASLNRFAFVDFAPSAVAS